MSIQPLLNTQTDQLEGEIRRDVIEIRQELPKLGYRLKKVYKEGRNGLIFCALYELVGSDKDAEQAIGYPRVSMYQQSGNHSLVTQVRQMLDVAEERGQVITRIYVEAGLSGADSRRPAFQAMMRDAIHGEEDGPGYAAVFCYDLYRFYRNLVGLVSSYRTLSEQGVDLVSVAAKDTDLSSRFGKMLMYLRGIMGEMYLDDLSRTTTDNKFRRAMKGYSNASTAPFGYCRGNCFQCTDNQGEGYCPRFGDRQDLWRELGDDPKVFVPHPVDRHAVRLAFDLYGRGEVSDTDIARRLSHPLPDEMGRLDLNSRIIIEPLEEGQAIVLLEDGTFAIQYPDRGLQFFRPQGRPGSSDPSRRFSKDTIRDVLQNPYYAGFVPYRKTLKEKGLRVCRHKRFKSPLSGMTHSERGDVQVEGDSGMLFPGLHTPLIEVSQFDRCQQVRGIRGHNASNASQTRRIYPLSGMLKCERCREPFRGNAGNGNVRYYEDSGVAKGTSNCPQRMFRAEPIEEVVFTYVKRLRIPDTWDDGILSYLREGGAWDDLRRERRSLRSRMSAVREMNQKGIMSLGEVEKVVRRCERRLESLERDVHVDDDRYQALLRDFPQLWETATDQERKGLIRCIFSAIWFRDGDVTRYELWEPFAALLPEA